MSNGRSFKSDDSFLEKLAIGAFGTKKVIEDLSRQGFNPIELERGSTGYKIWKAIKIKRIRVPDILCLKNGIRVESRAKTSLIISMSHSEADANRGWDYGLRDEDFVALVKCKRIGERAIDWEASSLVQYIRTSDLRTAFSQRHVIIEKRKGAEEGFESRLTWPAAIAKADGQISYISNNRLQYKRKNDNRTITLRLTKNNTSLTALVKEGNSFPEDKILASVVPVNEVIKSTTVLKIKDYIDLLSSTSISDRYSATKALSYIGDAKCANALLKRMKDVNEHIYVRLEAAASLIRYGHPNGLKFINEIFSSDYLEYRLEAVIILSEIRNKNSLNLLIETISDNKQHSEIRAGAAWALGELRDVSCLPNLISAFSNVSETMRIEAARALAKISESNSEIVLEKFASADEITRPGLAWALSKRGKLEINKIFKIVQLDSIDTRHWLAFIFGYAGQDRIIGGIEELKNKDPELYFAVTLLWKILSSWVYNLEEV